MKISELNKCLCGKLKFEQSEKRHTDYRMRCSGGLVGLPTLLRISRGAGELTNGNVVGIAKGLGLNEHDLRQTVSCMIGRPCVLLCVAVMLLQFVDRKRQEQGELFQPGLLAMVDSVQLLLAEPDVSHSTAWRPAERKALERSRRFVDELVPHKDLGAVAKKVIELMQRG